MKMQKTLITGAKMINEGNIQEMDILIEEPYIASIMRAGTNAGKACVIEAQGKYLLPGIIDEHVHFREPGLTHKADIYTESRAAVAGGVTSFMDMPNTIPQTTNHKTLEWKLKRASKSSLANYAFYLGATNDNLNEILDIDPAMIPGVKVFMGASTGNMRIDDEETLINIFSKAPCLIAVHCEDEDLIRKNLAYYQSIYAKDIPLEYHSLIRSADACQKSTQKAIALAREYDSRLHVLHLSSVEETKLFTNKLPSNQKQITSEVCIHHLWFSNIDYKEKGTKIKWNPSIKTPADKKALWEALLDDRIGAVATDHAPHTLQEKQNPYLSCPSGAPMVQHSLSAMFEMAFQRKLELTRVVEKMCHAPALLFNIHKRGFIREGYFADLVLIDPNEPWEVNSSNILYKCGWSPMEGTHFSSRVTHTWVNGHLVYKKGLFDESRKGMQLMFDNR